MNKKELDDLFIELRTLLPHMRYHDIFLFTEKVDAALRLPLDDKASWGMSNIGGYLTAPETWQAIIEDMGRGFRTSKSDTNLAHAICLVWVAWKHNVKDQSYE